MASHQLAVRAQDPWGPPPKQAPPGQVLFPSLSVSSLLGSGMMSLIPAHLREHTEYHFPVASCPLGKPTKRDVLGSLSTLIPSRFSSFNRCGCPLEPHSLRRWVCTWVQLGSMKEVEVLFYRRWSYSEARWPEDPLSQSS